MKYKIVKPCVVRSADSDSAVSYRRVGEVVDIPHDEDAKCLVAQGFVESLKPARAESLKPEPKSDSVPGPKPGP